MSVPIPAFSREDFYTSAPYAWLVEQEKANGFDAEVLKDQLREMAQTEGVKNFISKLNAYKRMQSGKGKITLDSVTAFDRQPMTLKCGPYICDEDGVNIYGRDGEKQQVCTHPIMPIRRLVNEDTGEERLLIAYRKGDYWRPPIAVPKSTIASAQKILDLSDLGVVVNNDTAKLLSTYLLKMEELNYHTLEERRSVGRLGWIGDRGFAPYIDELEFDGEANYKQIFNAVCHHGSREAWIEAIKAVRAEKTVARIAIAASFASALLEPCGLLPFFLHTWGGTGTGKTVSLKLAASVWASPRMGEFIQTWNATDVGQEMTAAFLNSLPYCMDELQIQAASGMKDFDRIIYKLTEGIGRTRGAKGGGLRQITRWRNCILTTGEFPLVGATSMGGSTVRVIEVECDKPVYSDLLGICKIVDRNHGFAGEEFVKKLMEPGEIDRIEDLRMGFYRQLMEFDGAEKQAASMSAILAADALATELFFQDGNALTVEDMAGFITKADSVSANFRALDYIYDKVAQNQSKFLPSDKPMNEIWGKVEGGQISIIKTTFDQLLRDGGFSPRAFLTWASRQKDRWGRVLLQTGDGRHNTKKVMLGNAVPRCVVLAQSYGEDPFEELDGDEPIPF